MKKYDHDGFHWWAPERKLGGGWVLYKDTPTPPTPPNPQQTAQAQTSSNIATANANAALNRVNQYTPWGNLTYNKAPGSSFDQTGYDQAMANYQQQLAAYQANPQASSMSPTAVGNDRATGQPTAPSSAPPEAPNRNAFMTPGVDNWSSTVSLSPVQQQLLDAQNSMSLGLADVGKNQIGTVGSALSTPLSFNGLPQVQNNSLQTSVQAPGLQTGIDTSGVGKYQNGASYGAIQDRLDTSNVPALVGGNALAGSMKDAQAAAYKQQSAYLDPQYAQQQHDLENQLAQQGVMQNSDAWNRAMDDFQRNKTFAYNNAYNNSVGLGNAAQAQLFGEGLQANQNQFGQDLSAGQFANQAQAQGFGQALQNAELNNQATQAEFGQAQQQMQAENQAKLGMFGIGMNNAQLNNQASNQAFNQDLTQRNQAINELMTQRQNPLNELNALRTGSQVTSPQFSGVPQTQVPGTDIAGLIGQNYANQMGLYNSQVGSNNSMMGGLFSLGSAALPSLLKFAL